MVADGIIIQPCDVQYDIIWRPAGGGADVTLLTFNHHFEKKPPLPSGMGDFSAVLYEESGAAPRADAKPGDLLVWRFTVTGTDADTAYIPNGDGVNAMGRIPFLELP